MRRLGNLILGTFTMAPLLYFAFFMLSLGQMAEMDMDWLFRVHAMVMATSFGLLGFYGWHIMSRAAKQDRTPWLLLIFFTGTIGMALYWYKFLWKRKQPSALPVGIITPNPPPLDDEATATSNTR